MFKKMSIRVKMLLGILPVLVAAMVLLTLISASRSKTIIINQVVDTANADLQANVNSVDSNLEQRLSQVTVGIKKSDCTTG